MGNHNQNNPNTKKAMRAIPATSNLLGERALYLYAQAASQGHDFALLKMGDLVFYGFAGTKNSKPSTTETVQKTALAMIEPKYQNVVPTSYYRQAIGTRPIASEICVGMDVRS